MLRRLNWLGLVGALALASLLSACSLQPQVVAPTADAQAATDLWHWQVQGKLAVSRGQNSDSANLTWQQQGANYSIRVFGPLGQGAAQLEGEPFYVRLTSSNGEVFEAASPENLAFLNRDWQLPLSNLVYWVRGLPAPGQVTWLAENQIEQEGWQVQWRRLTQVDDYVLPSLLVVKKDGVSLRLALNKWNLTVEPNGLD